MDEILKEIQDLTYLSWSKTRKSSGTAGSFLKSYDDSGYIKKYYKLSDYDPAKGIIGHECINEIIVQRLLRLLCIEHLDYRLIHARIMVDGKELTTWLCESDDYKKNGESKIAFEDFYLINKKPDETPLHMCERFGWSDKIHGMLTVDYLVLNRDRHGANIEILRSNKDKSLRLAPLFDHGLSLVCRCHNIKELSEFDVMKDLPVQSFIGSRSSFENLKLVPSSFLSGLPKLRQKDRSTLFDGLEDILGDAYMDKIWEMIWRRWTNLGSL